VVLDRPQKLQQEFTYHGVFSEKYHKSITLR